MKILKVVNLQNISGCLQVMNYGNPIYETEAVTTTPGNIS
jgi:hypothetical protein